MSAIKPGDLVMIVRGTQCCGSDSSVGRPFIVEKVALHTGRCFGCKALFGDTPSALQPNGRWVQASRLKKIDPPAEGETREAYKELVA